LSLDYRPGPGRASRHLRTPAHLTCSFHDAHFSLLPGWAWTLLKTAAVLALLVAGRRLLPTLRMERYTELAWMVLVPLTLLQALVVAIVVLNR